ncbi:MAG: RNB domain-containing ribonuclease [Deltaproteobacteria bacterium]|nr:RNB domain-containing ribonuclease [Deltaproteobacteria bacterium]
MKQKIFCSLDEPASDRATSIYTNGELHFSVSRDEYPNGEFIQVIHDENGYQINEVYDRGSSMAWLLNLALSSGIPLNHSKDVLTETEEIEKTYDSQLEKFDDYTHLPFVTVDNPDSRDLDQAVFIEEEGDILRIWYAIADTTDNIPVTGKIFGEALGRGVSYHFDLFSLPMLPDSLSEDKISLSPMETRKSVIFITELDSSPSVRSFRVIRGLIKSRAKLSYETVQAYIEGQRSEEYKDAEWKTNPSLTEKAGKLLIKLNSTHGSLSFNREDLKFIFEDSAESLSIGYSERKRNFRIKIHPFVRTASARYHEQFSLITNTLGAKFLKNSNSPTLQAVYRVHDTPEEEQILNLKRISRELSELHENQELIMRDGESLYEFLTRAEKIENHSIRKTLLQNILYTCSRGRFQSTAAPHFALGINAYTRLTAPMREVVGVFMQKELLETSGMVEPFDSEKDGEIRDHVILQSEKGHELQKRIDKEIMRIAIEDYFCNFSDEPEKVIHSGTICCVKSSRIYIIMDAVPLEVRMYFQLLSPDTVYEVIGSVVKFQINDYTEEFFPGKSIHFKFSGVKENKMILIPVIN